MLPPRLCDFPPRAEGTRLRCLYRCFGRSFGTIIQLEQQTMAILRTECYTPDNNSSILEAYPFRVHGDSIGQEDENSLSNTLVYETVFIDYVHVGPKRNGRMCAYW
jgi:hypothetical protein